MPPTLSYTIWFSQRTGSTLLCKALESTGVAGHPDEWLSVESLHEQLQDQPAAHVQQQLWQQGSTANGVWGYKHSFYEPYNHQMLALLRQLPGADKFPPDAPRAAVWEQVFPHHRHIFMTRRNKVRQAVSWWKAIVSAEWHRQHGDQAAQARPDLLEAYHFDAINQLYAECSMREAGIQEFFSEAAVLPLTVVYEDFVLNYDHTVRRVLDFLGLDSGQAVVAPPHYDRLADEVSEAWAQRFRRERQENWNNRGW